MLAIEVDGSYHLLEEQLAKDDARTIFLGKHGISVIRLKNEMVIDQPDLAVTAIKNWIEEHSKDEETVGLGKTPP